MPRRDLVHCRPASIRVMAANDAPNSSAASVVISSKAGSGRLSRILYEFNAARRSCSDISRPESPAEVSVEGVDFWFAAL